MDTDTRRPQNDRFFYQSLNWVTEGSRAPKFRGGSPVFYRDPPRSPGLARNMNLHQEVAPETNSWPSRGAPKDFHMPSHGGGTDKGGGGQIEKKNPGFRWIWAAPGGRETPRKVGGTKTNSKSASWVSATCSRNVNPGVNWQLVRSGRSSLTAHGSAQKSSDDHAHVQPCEANRLRPKEGLVIQLLDFPHLPIFDNPTIQSPESPVPATATSICVLLFPSLAC